MRGNRNGNYNTERGSSNDKGKKPPIMEVRLGRCRSAVWAHAMKDGGTDFTVTRSRLYKDDQDKWADAQSFRRDDLPVLREVLQLTWKKLFEIKKQSRSNSDSDE